MPNDKKLSAYEVARQRYEAKRQAEGRACPKCGNRNFRHDPICRRCFHLVRPGLTAAIAGATVCALLALAWVLASR
jgi:hypothetical protein